MEKNLCATCTPKTKIGVSYEDKQGTRTETKLSVENDFFFWGLVIALFLLVRSLFKRKNEATTTVQNGNVVGLFMERHAYNSADDSKQYCLPPK